MVEEVLETTEEKVKEKVPEKIPEKIEVEDKYKLSFLQIDKRFVNLELAFGELSEKIKSLDMKAVSELQQKVDDLEDLITVEGVGVIELKNLLEGLGKKIEEPKETKLPLSPEDLNKISSVLLPNIESSVLPKIEERLSKIENGITSIPSATSTADVDKRLSSLSEELNALVTETRNEIKNLKEKTKPVDQDIIQKIVSEVSDLRTEFSKDTRYLKEKIEGEKGTKSEIDIKFLSSRVNSLKESIDYILNRKVETDLKIQNLERGMAVVKGMAEQVVPDEVLKRLDIKINSLEKSIEDVEKKFESLERIGETSQEFERKLGELKKIETHAEPLMMPIEVNERLTNLEEKINKLEGLKEKPYELRSSTLDRQIDELLSKIVFLESKVRVLESLMHKKTDFKPVVLE